jgi:glycosyltransferase involved in cell wall biosynthesis
VVNALNLGLVTNGSVGWKTVRTRWETDLADYAPTLHHIEDHARWASRLTERYAKSIGLALAGRAAAAEAIRAGANVVLLSTLQNAPFVPLPPSVNYAVYGDCTTAQLAELYGGKKLGFPGSAINARLRRLVDRGCYFLCMSAWYRDALRRELGVSDDRAVLLPFYVNTEKWKPLEQKAPNVRPQVLFIGGDLQRKGGDVVYELARLERFQSVDFHVVSPHAEVGPPNVRVHRSLAPESDALVGLAASSDIFILPTRADTSSLAAMEAAACGLPAIVTRCGGIPEIVLDGSTGSVLDGPSLDAFAAELSAYLSDPSMVAERGRNARQHILRNYSKTAHLAVLRDVIARAAAEARGDRQAPRRAGLTASPGTAACSAGRTPPGQARTTSERRG